MYFKEFSTRIVSQKEALFLKRVHVKIILNIDLFAIERCQVASLQINLKLQLAMN